MKGVLLPDSTLHSISYTTTVIIHDCYSKAWLGSGLGLGFGVLELQLRASLPAGAVHAAPVVEGRVRSRSRGRGRGRGTYGAMHFVYRELHGQGQKGEG